MKKGIHPKYYDEAEVTCQCGNKFVTGSTQPKLHVEICSACHPFFSGGGERFISRGRVDRFRAKLAAAQKWPLSNKKKRAASKGKARTAQA